MNKESARRRILEACGTALELASAEVVPPLPTRPELQGAAEWYDFEIEAWPLGENVRQLFSTSPKLKRCDDVLASVADVASCRALRRGRQSFILALGFVGAASHANTLASQLDDPDVQGQVVDTLLKMRVPGFASLVKPLLSSEMTWIRKLAQRYLGRYGN